MPSPQYKFPKRDVYQLGLKFVDKVYGFTNQIPGSLLFAADDVKKLSYD